MLSRFILVLTLFIALSAPVWAQGGDDAPPPPVPDLEARIDELETLLERAEDAANRAEDAASTSAEAEEAAGGAVDLAFNLLGLFEAMSFIVTIVGGAAAIFGVTRLVQAQSQLTEARKEVEEELRLYRERFEQEIVQREQQLDALRQNLEGIADNQRRATSNALLAQAFLPLAERQYRAQDYPGALDTYHRSLELAPNNPVIHYRLGYVYTQSGDLNQAEHHYQQAMTLAEDFAPAIAGLGFVTRRLAERMPEGMEKQQAFNRAEELLLRALTISPNLVDDDGESWWGVLGGLYRRRDQIDQAIHAYDQATKVTPHSSYGFGNLALLYLRKHNREEMVKTYARVERLAAAEAAAEVDNYWGHADLLVARVALGKFKEAWDVLPTTLEISPPDSPYTLNGLVETLQNLEAVLEPEKTPKINEMIDHIRAFQEQRAAELAHRTTQEIPRDEVADATDTTPS